MTAGDFGSFSKLSIVDEHFMQSKRLISGLEVASNRNERQSVLRIASISFDHDMVGVHDEEVQAGAASVLCQSLIHVLEDQEGNTMEAVRIAKILSMTYRCSNPIATKSLRDIGTPLLQTLLEAGEHRLGFRVAAEDLIDRLASLDVPLGSLIDYDKLMCFLIKTIHPDEDKEERNQWGVRYATRVLAGLTSHSDSKAVALSCPGLLNAVIQVAQNSFLEPKIREETAKILRNLAWESRNKAEMIRLRKPSCIGALIKLCSRRENTETRAHAVEALKYLSIEAKNKTRLVFFRNGSVVRALMGVLRHKSCPLPMRLSSIGAILNLVTRETSHCIARQKALLGKLASVASNSKEDMSVALLAAQTVKKLAAFINVHFHCHEDLLHALTEMSSCNKSGILLATSKAFAQQSLLPGCSFFMARSIPVLDILTKLANSEFQDVKASAIEAIENLAKDAINAKKLATNAPLLETLVDCAGGDSDKGEARQHAIKALLSLASHGSTTERVAKQLGLVASLASFGISQDEDIELKRAALQGVLLLAPLL